MVGGRSHTGCHPDPERSEGEGPKRRFGPSGCFAAIRVTTRLAVLALVAGCYTYRPLRQPEPEVGTRVSAELTGDGARALAGHVGTDVVHLEGRLLRADSAELGIAVLQVENSRGMQLDWNGEEVRLPRRFVAAMQERRLSLGATALLGGLAAVGLFAAYELIGGSGELEGSAGTPGGGAQ
jgi:hypothetical protein